MTENEAASEGRSPIWRLGDQAYASGPPLDDDFAKGVKEACGCGEVVPGNPN